MWEGLFGVYNGRMTTTPTPPDFSEESCEAAFHFVAEQIHSQIDGLNETLALLKESRAGLSPNFSAIVIAMANQYQDAANFQARWNLLEKK
jgi:hypothetical protein